MAARSGNSGGLASRIWRKWTALPRSQSNFVVPMEGWIFVAVTLAIGLAAINTSTQLLFLIFSMMCAFWILSAILATTSLRQISLRRIAPPVVTAGHPVQVIVRAANRKRRFTSFSLRVTDELDHHIPIGAVFFPRVPPADEHGESYRCVFPRRGIYRFRSLTLATRFPFGLIERHRETIAAQDIVVMPALVDVRRLMQPLRSRLGEIESHRRGRGTGLYALRDYVAGESSRDIHWKVSARRGQLMVKEYEEEERRRASVVLDNREFAPWSREGHADFERAIVLAGSVLAYLLREGHEVELVTASGRVGFDTGPEHLGRCRRALASLRPVPGDSDPPRGTSSEAECVRILIDFGRSGEVPGGDDIKLSVDGLRDQLGKAAGLEHEVGHAN
jgi:uncharacterized protein (DUF58 family)